MNNEDRVIELIAESHERKLTRAEKSIVNKAKWIDRKDDIHAMHEKKALARQPIGTAIGNKQRMTEFKELLLSQENGSRVIRKVLEIAMDDGNPGQMGALKLCIDRQLPMSMFEAKAGGQRTAISISIVGIGESATTIDNDTGNVTDV